jgi:hypothetical protein
VPGRAGLLEWRFLLAFGGGSMLCFALVFGVRRFACEAMLKSLQRTCSGGLVTL